ncbi:DNA-directed RNA polymerase I subunit A2, partial [Monoraphidium neglectum]
MALRRGAYLKRGANYTEAATLLRCVRPDQSSATVRCHYLTDGTVNFALTMRRAEYFIPAGILLKCFLELSDRELYDKLIAGGAPGTAHAGFLAARAELLLQQPLRKGLSTRADCLEYLGSHFRVVLGSPSRLSDQDVGLQLIKSYVFIHLDKPSDKLALLLQMLHKLYAL